MLIIRLGRTTVNHVTHLLVSKLLRVDCQCSKSNLLQHAVLRILFVSWSTLLVLSGPVNFEMFTLSFSSS